MTTQYDPYREYEAKLEEEYQKATIMDKLLEEADKEIESINKYLDSGDFLIASYCSESLTDILRQLAEEKDTI